MGGRVKYSTLLFDADEVLFDFTKAEATAFDATFRQYQLNPQDFRDDYTEINHRLWKQFSAGEVSGEQLRVQRFDQLFQRHKLKLDASRAAATYINILSQCGFLLPHALDAVAWCSTRFSIGLITNGLADVQRARLAHSGLASYFPKVIISEEVGYPKPHPRIFEIACEALGEKDRSRILMIGDNYETDIVGATEFGIDTCWVNPKGGTDKKAIFTYHIDGINGLKSVVS